MQQCLMIVKKPECQSEGYNAGATEAEAVWVQAQFCKPIGILNQHALWRCSTHVGPALTMPYSRCCSSPATLCREQTHPICMHM